MANTPHKMSYVFGPVPSRRLGRSLGVDLAPRKVCTMDCVYCQIGRTTRLTVERAEFVPAAVVLDEIKEKLRQGPKPDYITLAGSGEPTLNSAIGDVISGIKNITDVPVAVLTNGTLFSDPAVRRDCALADVVMPSLDAGDEETFQRVNRAEASLTLESLVAGMETFRKEYSGQIWLEVFLVHGMNSSESQLRKMRKLIDRIRPDRVQLNTAVRPTADSSVRALSEPELKTAALELGPNAEVVADFRRDVGLSDFTAGDSDVLDIIRRHPLTIEDIAMGMGIHITEAGKRVGRLLAEGKIVKEPRNNKLFYRAL